MDLARRDTRAVALGVAALHFLIDGLGDEPVHPSLDLRALLAFLHSHIGGNRKHFDDLWQILINPLTAQTQRKYMRSTYARTHWYGILRAADVDPGFGPAYAKIVRQYRLKHEADFAQRDAASRAVRLAGLMHELVAHKGHPRSGPGARLAEYMRRNGGSAEGYDPSAVPATTIEDQSDCGWL